MDLATAKKINKTLVDYYLHEVTHQDVPPGPLPDYSLEDMLEAARIMAGHSEPGETAGGRTSYMTCAKRLVAAMYVLRNYHTVDLDNLTDVVVAGDGRALLCLKIRDLLNLEQAWRRFEGEDDCLTCGKVDPDELPESRSAELLRQAIGLMTAMTAGLAPESLPEKMEDFLEAVAAFFPKFVWRKADGAYWASTDDEVFQPTANDW